MHNSITAATVKLITFTASNSPQVEPDQLAACEVVFIRSKIAKIVSPKLYIWYSYSNEGYKSVLHFLFKYI